MYCTWQTNLHGQGICPALHMTKTVRPKFGTNSLTCLHFIHILFVCTCSVSFYLFKMAFLGELCYLYIATITQTIFDKSNTEILLRYMKTTIIHLLKSWEYARKNDLKNNSIKIKKNDSRTHLVHQQSC